jgi:hypothetical protein
MVELQHNRHSTAERKHRLPSDGKWSKREVKCDSITEPTKKSSGKKKALELAVIAPLISSCASGQFLDPKDDWFSYKAVGIFLVVFSVLGVVEHFIIKHKKKKQDEKK